MRFSRLKDQTLKILRTQTKLALDKVLARLGPEEQGKGVYLGLYMMPQGVGGNKDTLELARTWIHGKTNYEEWPSFQFFVSEKGSRTSSYFKLNPKLRSAYQAGRNRDEDRYAGAIIVRCIVPELGPDPVWLIFSVSGLGEMQDEAVALLTAKLMPWKADRRDLGDSSRASKNEIAERLLRVAV